MKTGATEALMATVFPADAANKAVSWSSSNDSVAKVDADGVVTAKAEGTAIITATTVDGKMTAICTVTVTKEKTSGSVNNPFVDVTAGAYFYDAVLWATENNITNGVDKTHFGPGMGTTRAQVVTFLWRAAGCPEPSGSASQFSDVVSGSYYEKAVAWAVAQGITNGTSKTTFSPNKVCTEPFCTDSTKSPQCRDIKF